MTAKKFEFTSPHIDVEIGGEKHQINLSDEKVFEYQKLAREAQEALGKSAEIDPATATLDDFRNAHAEAKDYAKSYIDTVLGEGSFDKFYDKSGRSLAALTELIVFLSESMTERTNEVTKKQRNKYVKKG